MEGTSTLDCYMSGIIYARASTKEIEMPPQRTRVPFSRNDPSVIVTAGPRVGERFSVNVDIDEGCWRDELFAAEVLKEAIHYAITAILREKQPELQSLIMKWIMDASFVKSIVEQELRQAAREMVLSLWSDEEKKNLRDWFERFTNNLTHPAQGA